MGVRIFEPGNYDEPFLEQCDLIPPNRDNNLCAYRTINLKQVELPIKDLEVQVTIYPLSQVTQNDVTKEYTCPPPVSFAAGNNLPFATYPAPALGGRAYYHPGDSEVRVVLGCTDLSAINEDPSCKAKVGTEISATVTDFMTRQPVLDDQEGAHILRVAVGEPRELDTIYVMNPVDEIELSVVKGSDPLRWSAEIDRVFDKHVCLDVLEFGSEVTPVLKCTTVEDAGQLNLRGFRLRRKDLRDILTALDNANIKPFPDDGLTIGIVLDQTSQGAPDYEVRTDEEGTVTYLSGPTTLGGTRTSTSGIFVSTDAPFGTRFSTAGARPTVSAIGGKVAGKVTLVVLPPAGSPSSP
ncbi:MAG: hypothetical protein H7138_22680 [Myxococcales bacterium]|nr:hypothetical protein [Myxococcales bacterium]